VSSIGNTDLRTTARRTPTNRRANGNGAGNASHRRQTERFLAAYGAVASHCRPRRHLLPADEYRQEMMKRFQIGREITDLTMAA
jgi:hypothetical protein